MSQLDDVGNVSPRDWRDVCGQIGWAVLAIAATIIVLTVIEVFAAAVGLALGGGLSVDQAAGIMLRIRITLGVVAAVVVMAVIAARWGLFTVSLLVLGVLILFASAQLTTAS